MCAELMEFGMGDNGCDRWRCRRRVVNVKMVRYRDDCLVTLSSAV